MSRVVWRRLVLHGFGRFRDRVTLELGPGVNVLAAPNESGKSTLVAGLAAVLFGLSTGGGPSDFGQGRWRNWFSPPRFAGELELEAADVRYRIARDFANHRIHVARLTPAGWREVAGGEHNPGARRRNARYEQFLAETIGLTSRELFVNIFALGQPLPEPEALDERVQQLLSGAGAAAYREALEHLVAGVRRLTKYSRELGVTDRNAHRDGRLEELDQRIAALEHDIASSRAAADSLEVVQARVLDLEQRENEARRQLQEAESGLNAWNHWRALLVRRRTLLDQQVQLERAVGTLQKLEAAYEERANALAAAFPELAGSEAQEAQLLQLGSRLVRLQQLQERIRAEREAIVRELAALQGRAAALAQEWAEFQEQRERLAGVEAELKGYQVFAAAGEGLRERLASYQAHRLRLERAVTEAREQLATWREPRERYEAEESRFAQAFADLAPWDEDSVRTVDQRLALLEHRDKAAERLRDLEDALRHARRRCRARMAVAWLAGLALAGGLAYAVHREAGWAGALAVVPVILALAGGLAHRLATPVRELKRRVGAAVSELEAVDGQLAADGRFAGLGPAELGALHQRLLARAEAAAALEAMRRRLPDADEERVLLERVVRAERDLREFMAETAPARERFGDGIEEAYRRWLRLTQEAEGLRAAVAAFAQRHTGLATRTPETVPAHALAGLWGELAQLLAATGRTVHTMGQVAAQLAALPAAFWDEAQAARERQEPLFSAIAEADALRAQLADVLAAADGDVGRALARWEQWRAGREELARLARERAGVLAAHGASSPVALRERLVDVANQAAAVWQQLEQWSAAHPGLPSPDEAADGEALAVRLRQFQEERDRWQAEVEQAGAEKRRLLEEQARLSGSRVINIAQAEEELAALRRERSALDLEARAMARAHRELAAAVEDYQVTHRMRLADAATGYFQRFTESARRVELDEGFAVAVRVPDGRLCSVAQLSQGAQDQLYLALRLAIADLVSGAAPLPLLLDDPFVNCDAVRLERIRAALDEVASQRQVVLFTHRAELQAWGCPVRAVEDNGP